MKIICKSIFKSYRDTSNSSIRQVLQDVSFSLDSGDSLSISGPSGAGKSTLLNIISGLDNSDEGDVYFDELCFSNLSMDQKTQYRLQKISLVFQSFNLLKDFNVIENITLPLRYKGWSRKKSEKCALSALEVVDLIKYKSSSVTTLSGGEGQRVGIARALAMNSRVILADEPTGNLDRDTSVTVVNNLVDICKNNKITLVVVSHDDSVLSRLNINKKIIDGRII